MYERKILIARQNGGRRLLPPSAGAADIVAPLTQPMKMPAPAVPKYISGAMLAHFGRAMADLLACERCFVSTIPRAMNVRSEQVRIGYSAGAPVSPATLAQMASRYATHAAMFPSLGSDDSLVGGLIGQRNGHGGHSIVGQLMAGDGSGVVFAAGWRKTPFLASEMTWLTRAIPVIWSTAEDLLQPQFAFSEMRIFLEQLVSAAFVVDENLHLHETNRTGRKLLAGGKLLRADRGVLVGANTAITEALKDALHNVAMARADRRWTDATVPLSADGQRFAFAWVGTLPIPHEPDHMLVFVPRVDAVAGARRIAAAFNLNSADEKIIARILYGHCPRRIGADLGLTEATVRTYTKRIMLKLGINRQSELFLLYILTLSPFSGGFSQKPVPTATVEWKPRLVGAAR